MTEQDSDSTILGVRMKTHCNFPPISRLQLVPGSDSEEEDRDRDLGQKQEKDRANESAMAKKLEKDFLC